MSPLRSPFGSKTLKQDFTKNNPSKINLRLYAAVTSCKKTKKFHALIFHKTFHKTPSPHAKNSENFSGGSGEKLRGNGQTEQRIYGQTDRGCLQDLHIVSPTRLHILKKCS